MKELFVKISQNAPGNICAEVSFLIKLLATLLKSYSYTGVFL